MSKFTSIVRSLTAEKFAEILEYSPRKAREIYFHRHGIRKGKKSNQLKKRAQAKGERAGALFDLLNHDEDEEMVEELLRTWLLANRKLLGAALDHLGIDHKDGLTESEEVKKFEELKGTALEKLRQALTEVANDGLELNAYLRFMGVSAKELE